MKTKSSTRIAIQGVKGSFHHIAAQQFIQNCEVLECLTFDKVVEQLQISETDYAIMALENSIAGSIIPNFALIDQYQLHIIGEVFLDIQHHLMALPGQTIHDIEEVYSHPMALLQCKTFFKKYPHIKLIEDKDTAWVAQRIKNKHLKKTAAIAGDLAAKLYDLEIVAPSIQTIKYNQTRFAVLSRKPNIHSDSNFNKASLKFELDHKRGSLATILNVMSDQNLNLTKIQSLPIIERPWKYAFFVDVTFGQMVHYLKMISLIEIMAENFKVLGVYEKGITPAESPTNSF